MPFSPGLPVLLLALSGVASGDRAPPAGSYGFNWLDPHSNCRKLSKADLAKASKCVVSRNAFGLEMDSHACRIDAHVELIVYKTAAQCQQALEAMQANGD